MGCRDGSDLSACLGTTANLLHSSKLIHCTPHGFCELSCALLHRQQNWGGELNWGCWVPSVALESCHARHAAKQGQQ